jgi:small-conductance mechanosensitive channel
VKEISLRATMVATSEGADILIPNNTLLSQNLKNWTISSKQRLIELKLKTCHDTIPEEVMSVIGSCMDDLTDIIRPKSVVVLSDINETGFVFTIRLLITDLAQASAVRSQLLTSVSSAFGEKGIGFAKLAGSCRCPA